MKSLSRSLWRGLAVASVTGLLTLSVSVAPQAHAQSARSAIRLVSITNGRPGTGVPISYIVPVKTSAIYYPSYLPNCSSAGTGAQWNIYNDTTAAQTVVDLVSGSALATLQPKQTAGFKGGGPGFYLNGLQSNGTTAVVIKCS